MNKIKNITLQLFWTPCKANENIDYHWHFLWCFSDKYCKTGTREHQVKNKKSFSSFAFM